MIRGECSVSRRALLVALSGASGAAILSTVTPADAAKVPQKAVKYQDTPKGDQSCENCALFEAPSSCRTVDGVVSSQGWCMVYAKKSG